MTMLEQFTAARQAGVPIVVIRTADQIATADTLAAASADYPVVVWDTARGMSGRNAAGQAAMKSASVKKEDTIGFTEAMLAAQLLPKTTLLCAYNAHRQLQSQEPVAIAGAVQAVANLRDTFKQNFRMLVLLGPHFVLPPELDQDVVAFEDPLPGPEALATIVTELHASAKPPLERPDAETLAKAVDAVSGLSSFAAEQVVSMSLRETGLDLGALWERKRAMIEQAPGLSVWRGTERFADLVGLDAIKMHLQRRIQARTPIGVVVFLDEVDKVLANIEHDTSGVRLDQLRTLLTEMENNEWRGLVAVGVAGGGKSALAKAFGIEAGVPTIALDLSGMESKYVGESEGQLRHSMAVIKAVGRGNAYLMATSNNASVMRPELQRRFTDGLWFFDLMTAPERAACWLVYLEKYGLKEQARPDDDGWTGAEIRNCCRYAWDTNCSLLEASQVIVPMARSRADAIEDLRRHAHEKFLDANRPGTYRYEPEPMAKQIRAIQLPRGVVEKLVTLDKES